MQTAVYLHFFCGTEDRSLEMAIKGNAPHVTPLGIDVSARCSCPYQETSEIASNLGKGKPTHAAFIAGWRKWYGKSRAACRANCTARGLE